MYGELDDVGEAAFFVDDDWLSLQLKRRDFAIYIVPSPEPLLARVDHAQHTGLNAPDKVQRQLQRQATVVRGFIELGWAQLWPGADRRAAPGMLKIKIKIKIKINLNPKP
jgi:hypothetical protein